MHTTPPSGRHELAPAPPPDRGPDDTLGLVMGGGGARAAYQAGVLRHIARRFPELRVPVITGVSAGAINAALLASHHGSFAQAVEELEGLWAGLTMESVFRVDLRSLLLHALRWSLQLLTGSLHRTPRVRGLVDTSPLRAFLAETLHSVDGEITGVGYNLASDRLRAVALLTVSYTTGRSISWVQGKDVPEWERPLRRSRNTVLTVDHVMASAALPLFFPAVRIGEEWYGDGGIRLTAPLAPALHLGAARVLALSTHQTPTSEEADRHEVSGYPPPAQVLGLLVKAVFLDLLDQDARRVERLNGLLRSLPEERREGLRPIDLLVIRPSQNLAALAAEYEPRLPRGFRFMTRNLGTRRTRSADALSLVLFHPDYLRRLMDVGEEDAEARSDEIAAFLQRREPRTPAAPQGKGAVPLESGDSRKGATR